MKYKTIKNFRNAVLRRVTKPPTPKMRVLLLLTAAACVAALPVEKILLHDQVHLDKGQYNYKYASGIEEKEERRLSDGSVEGSYSYVDDQGVLQTVKYSAGVGGFKVAATNLPVAVVGKELHHVESTLRSGGHYDHDDHHGHVTSTHHERTSTGLARDSGLYTPEVAKAREQHAAAHAAALEALPTLRGSSHELHHTDVHHTAVPVTHFDTTHGHLHTEPSHTLVRVEPHHTLTHTETHGFTTHTHPHGHVHHTSEPHLRHHELLAEDVPLSEHGETPEVAAAREHHLAVHAEIKASLPDLEHHEHHFGEDEHEGFDEHHHFGELEHTDFDEHHFGEHEHEEYLGDHEHHSSHPHHDEAGFIEDTPEVKAAKKKHFAVWHHIAEHSHV